MNIYQPHLSGIGAHSYTLIVMTISAYRYHFKQQFPLLSKEHRISVDAFEYFYDWVIREALSKVLNITYKAHVIDHHRHDVYKCAYAFIGFDAELALNQQIATHGLRFMQGEEVKILVAGENIILARSFPEGLKHESRFS